MQSDALSKGASKHHLGLPLHPIRLLLLLHLPGGVVLQVGEVLLMSRQQGGVGVGVGAEVPHVAELLGVEGGGGRDRGLQTGRQMQGRGVGGVVERGRDGVREGAGSGRRGPVGGRPRGRDMGRDPREVLGHGRVLERMDVAHGQLRLRQDGGVAPHLHRLLAVDDERGRRALGGRGRGRVGLDLGGGGAVVAEDGRPRDGALGDAYAGVAGAVALVHARRRRQGRERGVVGVVVQRAGRTIEVVVRGAAPDHGGDADGGRGSHAGRCLRRRAARRCDGDRASAHRAARSQAPEGGAGGVRVLRGTGRRDRRSHAHDRHAVPGGRRVPPLVRRGRAGVPDAAHRQRAVRVQKARRRLGITLQEVIGRDRGREGFEVDGRLALFLDFEAAADARQDDHLTRGCAGPLQELGAVEGVRRRGSA